MVQNQYWAKDDEKIESPAPGPCWESNIDLIWKTEIEDVEKHGVEFEEVLTWTADELKSISEDASDNVDHVDWYNGSFFAAAVCMTWKVLNSIGDDFNFEESALKEKEALKMLQKVSPLSHGLELYDRRFTLRDVFDLAPLPRFYHATLFGCGSGMSKTTWSNDVLGLVPAFLYTGAASTVNTLWPFDDKDAAMYTEHFYEEFDKILQSGQKGVVDLAKANQKAVLTIMEERPAFYHWAPFILNGYWMLHLPGK
ncbi:hypothetical protein G7Y79_00054g089180 [Physcia stellaris]|nr:hypothetical protein G7Y79_00054g089180 [Physcia stellaris]